MSILKLPLVVVLTIVVACSEGASDDPPDGDMPDVAELPDGGCWDVAPALRCDDVGMSESPSETPEGAALLTFETADARTTLCGGSWSLKQCGRTETFVDRDGRVKTKRDESCSSTPSAGGAVYVRYLERWSYAVEGDERWSRTTTWDHVEIARGAVP